jgi:hypothetical protein
MADSTRNTDVDTIDHTRLASVDTTRRLYNADLAPTRPDRLYAFQRRLSGREAAVQLAIALLSTGLRSSKHNLYQPIDGRTVHGLPAGITQAYASSPSRPGAPSSENPTAHPSESGSARATPIATRIQKA